MKKWAALLLVLVMSTSLFGCAGRDYQQASDLFNEGKIEEARAIFEKLGDYEDSKGQVKECDYKLAEELFTAGQYEEARIAFEKLEDYKDSANFEKECRYKLAESLFVSENYEEAMNAFEDLEDLHESKEYVSECKYNLGIKAMNAHEWDTAASWFADLNYKESKKMLTDCQFMTALRDSVTRRMEMNTKENTDSRSLVSSEFAYLEKFRNAKFYDKNIQGQAKKYLSGLDSQLKAFNYTYYYEYQRDWYTGVVARNEVLDTLYRKYDFMADNTAFVGEYINQLKHWQNWLKAFNDLEENGHEEIKNPTFKSNTITMYFKNNTPYRSNQVFDIEFCKDQEGTKLLGSTSVTVKNIQPYQEYTVTIYKPSSVPSNYWLFWFNYYADIFVD